MAKHDRRRTLRQPPSSRSVAVQVPLPVLGVLRDVRQAFHGLCISTGLQVLQAMMEGDRDAACGPKGRHQATRTAWRGGSVASHVTLGGRQVSVPRLRVRSAAGEVPLASFQWAAATDPLEAHTLEAIAAGVSTRRYARTLDPVPREVEERATSRSAVSRRFVAFAYVAEVEHGIRGSGTRNPLKRNARRSAATIGQPVTSIEGGSGDRDVPIVP